MIFWKNHTKYSQIHFKIERLQYMVQVDNQKYVKDFIIFIFC